MNVNVYDNEGSYLKTIPATSVEWRTDGSVVFTELDGTETVVLVVMTTEKSE